MNRKKRKAIQRFKKRYGKATNPFWQAQPQTGVLDASLDSVRRELDAAMREAFEKCARGGA